MKILAAILLVLFFLLVIIPVGALVVMAYGAMMFKVVEWIADGIGEIRKRIRVRGKQ